MTPEWLWHGLLAAAIMLWETFWALVFGLLISACLQVFVSREKMTRYFGKAGLREMAIATFLGAVSSSCSYAAVATAKTSFKKGARLATALAFMFASTNLVIELGFVLWALMGPIFVLAEAAGAFVLIGVMWLLVTLTFPRQLEDDARTHATSVDNSSGCHEDHSSQGEHAASTNETDPIWSRIAVAFFADISMLWKELLGGFLIAGFLMALIPDTWWKTLFLANGAPSLRLVENAAVGPLIAMASFVCSVGNIPLAALLWSGGISFSGVISFIYADLIVPPILLLYRKYYGSRAAVYISVILYLSMVAAGIIIDLLFTALGLAPEGTRPVLPPIQHMTFRWNYTTWLDLAALTIFIALTVLANSRKPGHKPEHSSCCH